jgi:hypothetical protein
MKVNPFRLLVALLIGLVPMLPAVAQNVDAVGLSRAIQAQERNSQSLFSVPGVVGTGVGVNASGRPVIKIYAESGVVGIPRNVDGVPVQVVVTGAITALKSACSGPPSQRPDSCNDGGSSGGTTTDAIDPTSRFDRPVPIGVSTGHPDITAGTIGVRVTNNIEVFALSNNHVYANQNQASRGDNVLQPGAYDGGVDPADAIGTLFDYQYIDFSTSASNVIDAAIARSSPAVLGNATPADGYGVPKSVPVDAVPGMRVMKYGRTTGQTTGRIDAINAIVNVGYDVGVARFVRQIVIRGGSFSAGGDSGSLIVVQGGRDARSPVGLLFAGGAGVTIANPIGDVLARFSVLIDGE